MVKKSKEGENTEAPKTKVILFGAAKFIFEKAVETLDGKKTKIIAFSDNDKHKWNIVYEGIDIIRPEDIKIFIYDYILIGAWYSYGEIKKQLMDLGVAEKKIMPLLEIKSLKWIKDDTSGIDKDAITKIFRNGEKIINKLQEVNDVNKKYEKIEEVKVGKVDKTDFSFYPMIAHACGGYINGEKNEYTNSLEALKESIENGFKMFECDVWGIQNKEIILGSRLKMQYPIEINYTILTLAAVFEMIVSDKEMKVILDIKYHTMEDFFALLKKIEELVEKFENQGHKEFKKRILIETFDEESTKFAISKKWECLLTDYRNWDGRWIKKSAVICSKYKIKTLMIDAKFAIENEKYIRFLLKKNFEILCYTVDEIEEYAALKKMGISSCLTNFLKSVQ